MEYSTRFVKFGNVVDIGYAHLAYSNTLILTCEFKIRGLSDKLYPFLYQDIFTTVFVSKCVFFSHPCYLPTFIMSASCAIKSN